MPNNQKTIIALEMALERLVENKGELEYMGPREAPDFLLGYARGTISTAIADMETIIEIAKEEGE